MFEKNKKPELRFTGSTYDWKKWKIEDILTVKKCPIELEDTKEYELVTVKRRNEGVVSRGFLKGKSILVKNYFEIEEGDYIISKRQVVHGANGIVPKCLDKAIVSNEYLVIGENENIANEFWAIISKLPSMYHKFFISSYGIDIEKLVFDVEDWKKRTITIPLPSEQKRIIEFFKNFDKLFSLHQQKYNKLTNLKKAMLEKMFPKEGADVPEIRFKGFARKWEEKSLGELSAETYGGGTPSTSTKEYWNGDLPWIQSSDLSDGKLSNVIPRKRISKKGLKASAAKLVPKNSIAIVTRVGVGKLAFMPFEYATSQDFLSLSQLKMDNWFGVYSIWNKIQRELHSVQGTSIKGITKEEVLSKRIMIPNQREEQKMIGVYFQNLDSLITQHQMQLAKLKIIKKAFLEKMFV